MGFGILANCSIKNSFSRLNRLYEDCRHCRHVLNIWTSGASFMCYNQNALCFRFIWWCLAKYFIKKRNTFSSRVRVNYVLINNNAVFISLASSHLNRFVPDINLDWCAWKLRQNKLTHKWLNLNFPFDNFVHRDFVKSD